MDVGSQETPSDDFGFAFNQRRFSDSVLRIEIVPDPPGSGAESGDSLADWIHNRKRPRDDLITNSDGGGTAQEPETSSGMELVKTIHISSPILAIKSPFFYKLLSNGERDSEPRHVTLRIHACEEDALMDLLNFIYCNTLRGTTPTALLKVLMAADKFEVASCTRYCSQLLQSLPLSCESALIYLDLPSILRMADTVQPLADAAKKFLAAQFKDIDKCKEEVLNLPLLGFEAVLSSDDLQVASEDVLFSLVLKWARKHYPKLQDRREILNTRLIRYIRFPYMSCRALKQVLLECDKRSLSSKAVLNALFHKAVASPHNDRSLFGLLTPPKHRAYSSRPMKVVEFELPRQQRICYLYLKRDEFLPPNSFCSVEFEMGGQWFVFSGQCLPENGSHYFCLHLEMKGKKKKGSASLTIDYEFATMQKPFLDFAFWFRGEETFNTGGTKKGCRNLSGVPWKVRLTDNSPYFIGGVLHLRAQLTVTKRLS